MKEIRLRMHEDESIEVAFEKINDAEVDSALIMLSVGVATISNQTGIPTDKLLEGIAGVMEELVDLPPDILDPEDQKRCLCDVPLAVCVRSDENCCDDCRNSGSASHT